MPTMQILDFAIQMEKDGETFYRDCAARTPDKGVASILSRLADAEVTHQRVLSAVKKERKAELPADTIRADVKNIFARMIESGERFGGEASELALYKRALDMEEKSRDFYTEKAEGLQTPGCRELFLRLAAEEQSHVNFIEGIVDFVARAEPGNWLEDAEWYHAEEY